MAATWRSAVSFVGQIFRSKAFGFLAVLFVLGTLLLIFGKLASAEWVDLMKWLGGGAVARSAVGDFAAQNKQIEMTKNEIANTVTSSSDAELAARAQGSGS
jgi:hypothetical protein